MSASRQLVDDFVTSRGGGTGPDLPEPSNRAFEELDEDRGDGGVVARRIVGLGAALAGASPARAECMGSCLDGMVAALASIAVYGLIGIVLLVMLIRAKWRRAGLIGLGSVAVLALGVPLLSQGWQAWKLLRMEQHEVTGVLPDLTARVPLLITQSETCDYSACAAVLWGRGKAGVHVLTMDALEGMDLTQPLPLADLPLEFWANEARGEGTTRRKRLTPDQRRAAVGRIDYLIVSPFTFYRAEPGEIEAGLQANPALGGLKDGVLVQMLMAPLDPAQPVLTLASLTPDLLDLTLTDRALAFPLAPLNDQAANNHVAAAESVARALCPFADGTADPNCLTLLDR